MSDVQFSNRILRRFAEMTALELGADQFNAILALANLPSTWAKPHTFLEMSASDSAHVYAALQAALRAYFGRGARGVLLRVGQHLWDQLLEDAPLGDKARAAFIRRLPLSTRHKPTLELLARFLGVQPGDVTVHTLDLDLLLVDHASPTTHDQSANTPICFVTQGLIRASLVWGTGREYDVEETSCKAMGEKACKFKITIGREP
ncbi:MAG TPA: V4R domain-containing protein [Anaerolineales bacterium]|nr:V4R domain-containing protein [Anaerolineales bacterium]